MWTSVSNTDTLSKTFAIVRPTYADSYRSRTYEFLKEMGYCPGERMVLAREGSDQEAAEWLMALSPAPDLILLPFDRRVKESGEVSSGLNIVEHLNDQFVSWRHIPILMPITDIAWSSCFQRMFEELKFARPAAADLVIPLPPSMIGREEIPYFISYISKQSHV